MRGKRSVFLTIKIRDVHWTPTKRKKILQRKGNLIRKFILNSFSFIGMNYYSLFITFYALYKAFVSVCLEILGSTLPFAFGKI